MGAAYFYHLTRRPLEATLPTLLMKARGAGWRVVVRGTLEDRMTWLDEKLWLGPDEGFFAHGLAQNPHAERQPILLTISSDSPNDPQCLMSVDGAEILPEEVNDLERVCVLFDGNNEDALNKARAQWKSLTDAGCSAQYWSEASGRWEKVSEK